ncbi:MAG: hypothetical protein ACO25F_09540 [Erythrobacter sp.]
MAYSCVVACMEREPATLLIVYNADGGLFSMVADALHKVLSPATYPCSLCALTYGAVAMHREWRRFLEGLPYAAAFHHRDDFARDFPDCRVGLPAILFREPGKSPEALVGREELAAIAELQELIELTAARLEQRRMAAS